MIFRKHPKNTRSLQTREPLLIQRNFFQKNIEVASKKVVEKVEASEMPKTKGKISKVFFCFVLTAAKITCKLVSTISWKLGKPPKLVNA